MSEETPLDKFKRALTGGARAIAREPEVEVAWSADRPGAAGKNFRVPLPGRQLPPEQAAEARAQAEAEALEAARNARESQVAPQQSPIELPAQ